MKHDTKTKTGKANLADSIVTKLNVNNEKMAELKKGLIRMTSKSIEILADALEIVKE